MNSPFKFLDPYTAEDRKVFFGRDEEVEVLYKLIYKSRMLMVYGQSGTGKTSLVQCGLGSKFDDTDWFPFQIRRNDDINHSLAEALAEPLDGNLHKNSIPETVSYIYKNYLRPVYLIFDQFEELFILGSKEEQDVFIELIKEILESELPCKILFVMREEYIAHLYRFEQIIPSLFDRRLRVERMNYANVAQVITGSCKEFNITLENEENNVKQIIDKISGGKSGIQLPYLQVYLDSLWQADIKRTYPDGKIELPAANGKPSYPALEFTSQEIEEAGNIDDALEKFLRKQSIEIQSKISKEFENVPADAVRQVLDVFVTEDGTKRPALYERGENREIVLEDNLSQKLKTIEGTALQEILAELEYARILRVAEGQIEIAHDALADLIDRERSSEQRQINQIRRRIAAAYIEQQETGVYLTERQLDSMAEFLPRLGLDSQHLAFIQESYEDAERKEAEEDERHQRELDLVQEKLKAEEEKREAERKNQIKLQKRYRLTIGLAVFSVIVAIWGWGMMGSKNNALIEANNARNQAKKNKIEKEMNTYANTVNNLIGSADNIVENAKYLIEDGYTEIPLDMLVEAENILVVEKETSIADTTQRADTLLLEKKAEIKKLREKIKEDQKK